MISKLALIFSAACLVLPVAARAQSVAGKTKCVIDGKTYFQQGACPIERDPVKAAAANRKNEEEAEARHALLCPGPKTPRIGMTEANLQCIEAYRYPLKINVTETSRGTLKQYVYDRNGGEYLYFTNGVMTSMQGQQR